jgi:hypothetical protein
MEARPMVAFVNKGEENGVISGDVFLAFLIAAGVVLGDFILNNLPI